MRTEPQVFAEPSTAPLPLTVQYAPRTVMVHPVTGQELDTIAALSNSVHLSFFGLCAGAATAFAIVLSTSDTSNAVTHASYLALFAVSTVGTIYFGVRALIDYRASRRKLEEIKRGKS